MKKNSILMVLACLLISLTAAAQSEKDKRIGDIRKMYAEAKKNIDVAEKKEKQGLPSNLLTVKSNYSLGGNSSVKLTTTYYFFMVEDDESDRAIYQPYFITNSYNTPGNKYYQEFLYDKDGEMAFYYERNMGNETRLYFAENQDDYDEGIVHEINTNGRTMEPPFAHRVSEELKHAFNLLINREF